MAGCEKCWSDAGHRAFVNQSDKIDEYHMLLEERKDKPCYLDCPEKHPDHYSYGGCPACGYRFGDSHQIHNQCEYGDCATLTPEYDGAYFDVDYPDAIIKCCDECVKEAMQEAAMLMKETPWRQ